MTAIAYTIRQGPNGLEVQFSADIASGREIEKRLAKWLNFAMESAMLEIQSRIKNGITIEKAGIAKPGRPLVSGVEQLAKRVVDRGLVASTAGFVGLRPEPAESVVVDANGRHASYAGHAGASLRHSAFQGGCARSGQLGR
jgi:hypothetical protein